MDWTEILKQAATLGDAAGLLATTVSFTTGIPTVVRFMKKKLVSIGLSGEKGDTLHNNTDIPILIQATPRPSAIDVNNFIQFLKQKHQAENNPPRFAPLHIIGIGDNPDAGGSLNDHRPDEWQTFIKEFTEYIHGIKRVYGDKQFHLFISAPSVLAFALGASLGHLYRVKVYNFDNKAEANAPKYLPVLNLPSDLTSR